MMAVQTKAVPDLRFTDFDGDWCENTLEELSEFRRGSFPQPYGLPKWYDEENGYPFVQVYDIDDNMRLKADTKSKISDKAIGKSVFIPKGTLIISIQGSIGRVAITQYDAYVDRTVLLFTNFLVPIDKKFFSYILLLLFGIEKRSAPGGTLKTITKEVLRSFSVQLPSYPEQQKIADFLTAVDKRIQQLEEKKRLLTEYKKGVMQQIFSQQIRFKDDNGQPYPDWEEKRLRDVGDIVTGKTPSTSDKSLWKGDTLFVTPTDMDDNQKYQFSTQRRVGVDNKKVLPPKSIMYTCIASIGKMSISESPSVTNQQINSIIPKGGYNNEYIYYALLNMTPRIKATQANTTLPIINKTDFSKFKVLCPCEAEQQKIADFLASIDAKAEQVNSQIKQAKAFKKGLLQQMFV